jgi:DNA helicase II / ATP-dependent DNA helicase PcrA
MFVWDSDDLNPEQEAAIREPGNVFLVACPGSGKTKTLTYKIADQLLRLQSDKQYVVAITYTHRAADEIQERIELLGVDTTKLWIGTIHSFCLEWIIKPYAIYHEALGYGYRVIDGHDSDRMLSDLCRPYRYPTIKPWDCGHYYTSTGRRLSSLDIKKHPTINAILDQYVSQLSKNRQIDFELILRYAHELVVRNPSISVLLGSIFSCILVDEYQDTKEIQYAIIASILKAGRGKVETFIVGDPNQAIFGSLGGFAITVEEFEAMAGIKLTLMKLSRNYRSSERIITYFGNFSVYPTEISSAAEHKDYVSLISFDQATTKDDLESELIRLIRHNIEALGILPHEVCVLAPQWVHLASMTRRLVAALPEYKFDGPGMVPFARDIGNFWYKLSKILLTEASPTMYVRRYRWVGEILRALDDAGAGISKLSRKSLLKECNSLSISETDGLTYLQVCFEALFERIQIDFWAIPVLRECYDAFFESSKLRIERLRQEGAEFIGDIETFRKVFEQRTGITLSTIHGIKGSEYDTVIAYGLLQDWVPHFSDPDGENSASKLLYVVCSRARKNLHLISECERLNGIGKEYVATAKLAGYTFHYDVVP